MIRVWAIEKTPENAMKIISRIENSLESGRNAVKSRILCKKGDGTAADGSKIPCVYLELDDQVRFSKIVPGIEKNI